MAAEAVVVIGAGINGLVAAAILARAGREVHLFEEHSEVGGLIATEDLTLPGFRHDTYSAWQGTFQGGPAWSEFADDLSAQGLSWSAAQGLVCGTLRADGQLVELHRRIEDTAEALGAAGATYLSAARDFARFGPALAAGLSAPPLSRGGLRSGAQLAREIGRRSARSEFLRDLVSSWYGWSTRAFGEHHAEVDALLAPWLLHAGMTPESVLGATTARMMAAGQHRFGLPVLRGGSIGLATGLARLVEEAGGHVHRGVRVEEVLHRNGRVKGVRLAGHTEVFGARAVLASVPAAVLEDSLLMPRRCPGAVAGPRLRPGRAAMQVHLALSAPPRWRVEAAASAPMLHITDGSLEISLACAQASAGLLPARPTVVVGQQYVLDPSRVPRGRASLWIQLQEVPRSPCGDSLTGERLDGWTPEVVDLYVNRVLERIGEHADGFLGQILATKVVTPADLERRSPNVAGGDPYGGALELDQSLGWRLPRSWRHHSTDIRGLWQIGASVHPGPGLSGASGWAAAHQLLAKR